MHCTLLLQCYNQRKSNYYTKNSRSNIKFQEFSRFSRWVGTLLNQNKFSQVQSQESGPAIQSTINSSVYWHPVILLQYNGKCLSSLAAIKNLAPCGTDGRLLLVAFNYSWPWPWPWIGSYGILPCISHWHVCTHQTSLKSEKNFFVDGLTTGTPPSSRSRDTKTRTNFKNLAWSNLDIVV